MQNKLLVTHKSPDLDAIASVWLLKRFDEQHFGTAELYFVDPGNSVSLDELASLGNTSYDVTHVDTGGGEFDHHSKERANDRVCAATFVYRHLQDIHPEIVEDDSLAALVEYVVAIDHFDEVTWDEKNEIRHLFTLPEILAQLKSVGLTDGEVVEYGLVSLDAAYSRIKLMLQAAQEIKNGISFETQWGEGIALKTANTYFVEYAQKQGYVVVLRKDPHNDTAQIKALPNKGVNLGDVYDRIRKSDPKAYWYLHPSETMLLNRYDRKGEASNMSLQDLIDCFSQK